MSTRGAAAALQVAEIRPRLRLCQRRRRRRSCRAARRRSRSGPRSPPCCMPNGCQHPAGETDQHAEVTGGRAGGHRERVAQIGRAVGVGGVGAAHGAGQHHRDGARRRSGPATARSLPWCRCRGVTTTPSCAVVDRGLHRGVIRSQSAAVSSELSTAIRSTTRVSDVQTGRQVRAAAGGPAHPVGAGAGRDGSSGGDDGKAAHGRDHPARHRGRCGAMPECTKG